jgi:hypothetical protein
MRSLYNQTLFLCGFNWSVMVDSLSSTHELLHCRPRCETFSFMLIFRSQVSEWIRIGSSRSLVDLLTQPYDHIDLQFPFYGLASVPFSQQRMPSPTRQHHSSSSDRDQAHTPVPCIDLLYCLVAGVDFQLPPPPVHRRLNLLDGSA